MEEVDRIWDRLEEIGSGGEGSREGGGSALESFGVLKGFFGEFGRVWERYEGFDREF